LCSGAAGEDWVVVEQRVIDSPVELARNMECMDEVGLLHAEELLSINGIFFKHIFILLQLNILEPLPDLVMENKSSRQPAPGITNFQHKLEAV